MMLKWAYILIGNDKTGKTHFQREMLHRLISEDRNRIDCNLSFPITHSKKEDYHYEVSFMNRSFQEMPEYENVETFFDRYFNDKDN